MVAGWSDGERSAVFVIIEGVDGVVERSRRAIVVIVVLVQVLSEEERSRGDLSGREIGSREVDGGIFWRKVEGDLRTTLKLVELESLG